MEKGSKLALTNLMGECNGRNRKENHIFPAYSEFSGCLHEINDRIILLFS